MFNFKELPDAQDYLFELNGSEDDSDISVLLTDEQGNESLIIADGVGRNQFSYNRLNQKEMMLHAINAAGDTLASVLNNSDGFFVFSQLTSGENIMFRLENSDGSEISEIKMLFLSHFNSFT